MLMRISIFLVFSKETYCAPLLRLKHAPIPCRNNIGCATFNATVTAREAFLGPPPPEPQNFGLFFSLSRHKFSSGSSRECWWCLKRRGPQINVHVWAQISTRRPLREGRKNENCSGKGRKKREIWGSPSLRGPPFGTHPSGPHCSWFGGPALMSSLSSPLLLLPTILTTTRNFKIFWNCNYNVNKNQNYNRNYDKN